MESGTVLLASSAVVAGHLVVNIALLLYFLLITGYKTSIYM